MDSHANECTQSILLCACMKAVMNMPTSYTLIQTRARAVRIWHICTHTSKHIITHTYTNIHTYCNTHTQHRSAPMHTPQLIPYTHLLMYTQIHTCACALLLTCTYTYTFVQTRAHTYNKKIYSLSHDVHILT